MGHKRKAGTAECDAERAAQTALAIEGLAYSIYTNPAQAGNTLSISETTLHCQLKGGKT